MSKKSSKRNTMKTFLALILFLRYLNSWLEFSDRKSLWSTSIGLQFIFKMTAFINNIHIYLNIKVLLGRRYPNIYWPRMTISRYKKFNQIPMFHSNMQVCVQIWKYLLLHIPMLVIYTLSYVESGFTLRMNVPF